MNKKYEEGTTVLYGNCIYMYLEGKWRGQYMGRDLATFEIDEATTDFINACGEVVRGGEIKTLPDGVIVYAQGGYAYKIVDGEVKFVGGKGEMRRSALSVKSLMGSIDAGNSFILNPELLDE